MAMFECPPEDGSYIPGQGFEAREMDEYLASAPDVEKCWGNWYFDGASSLLYNTERPEMCFDCRFRKGWQYVFSNLALEGITDEDAGTLIDAVAELRKLGVIQ